MIAAYTDRSSRTALTRYVVAATLVRGADGGAAVGLVLLAVSAQGYGPGGGARPPARGPRAARGRVRRLRRCPGSLRAGAGPRAGDRRRGRSGGGRGPRAAFPPRGGGAAPPPR